MDTKDLRRTFWFTFTCCQAVGIVLPFLANVHSNIAPAIVGDFRILPGSVLGMVLEKLPVGGEFATVVLVNAASWYAGSKVLRLGI